MTISSDIAPLEEMKNIQPEPGSMIKSMEEGKEKFDIVSTVAFLIGVPEIQFTSEKTTLKEDLYQSLLKNHNARLIRDISLVRVAIQKTL